MKIGTALVISLTGVVGVVVGGSAFTAQRVSDDVERLPQALPSGEGRPAPVANGLTFLLVGLDTSPGAALGGEPGMVAVGHATDDLHLVSLPPDLWVEGGDAPVSTLRNAFVHGGPAELVAAVEATSDVRIDHYAEVDLEAFRGLTDALGGITIDVPEEYRIRGEVFEAGPQQFDGDKALAYLRNPRLDPGVATAVSRQQQIVEALFERMRERGLLTDVGKLTDLIGLLTGSMRVDDTVDDATLARLAADLSGAGRPGMVSVPLAPGDGGEGSGQTLDEERAAALWEYVRAESLTGHLDEFE